MSWRAFSVVAGIVAFSTVLMAQDEPFLGTWEFNFTKSIFTHGAGSAQMKSHVLVNTAEPGGFKSERTAVTEKGTAHETHHYIFDGKFREPDAPHDPRELAFRRIDKYTIEETCKRYFFASGERANPKSAKSDGRIETSERRMEVSKDGKTLTILGTNGSHGYYTAYLRVYDKK